MAETYKRTFSPVRSLKRPTIPFRKVRGSLDCMAKSRVASDVRFVIAFRSPDGFVETGLRVPPPEKKATKLGFGVRHDSFSSPI